MSTGVSDQAKHKPACAATEASSSLEISAIESRDIILSKQRTTKALIRLRGSAGWSAPLLFAYDMTHFLMARLICFFQVFVPHLVEAMYFHPRFPRACKLLHGYFLFLTSIFEVLLDCFPNYYLFCGRGSPFIWLIACICSMSGANIEICAPPRLRCTNVLKKNNNKKTIWAVS